MNDGYYYNGPNTAPPRPKPKRWPWVAGALLALCVGGTIVSAVAGRGDGQPPSTTPAQQTERAAGAGAASAAADVGKKASPPAKPKPVTVGEGIWQVGGEVKPGTWTTTAGDHCYWARLSADGDTDAIIDNGNLDPGAHGRIAVKRSDKGLELRGDCVWTRSN